jgi:hypothetical protein
MNENIGSQCKLNIKVKLENHHYTPNDPMNVKWGMLKSLEPTPCYLREIKLILFI